VVERTLVHHLAIERHALVAHRQMADDALAAG
jgi:hypothetical protein